MLIYVLKHKIEQKYNQIAILKLKCENELKTLLCNE